MHKNMCKVILQNNLHIQPDLNLNLGESDLFRPWRCSDPEKKAIVRSNYFIYISVKILLTYSIQK